MAMFPRDRRGLLRSRAGQGKQKHLRAGWATIAVWPKREERVKSRGEHDPRLIRGSTRNDPREASKRPSWRTTRENAPRTPTAYCTDLQSAPPGGSCSPATMVAVFAGAFLVLELGFFLYVSRVLAPRLSLNGAEPRPHPITPQESLRRLVAVIHKMQDAYSPRRFFLDAFKGASLEELRRDNVKASMSLSLIPGSHVTYCVCPWPFLDSHCSCGRWAATARRCPLLLNWKMR
jgi:hypothetical protein